MISLVWIPPQHVIKTHCMKDDQWNMSKCGPGLEAKHCTSEHFRELQTKVHLTCQKTLNSAERSVFV